MSPKKHLSMKWKFEKKFKLYQKIQKLAAYQNKAMVQH